jgi:hypothetical protein
MKIPFTLKHSKFFLLCFCLLLLYQKPTQAQKAKEVIAFDLEYHYIKPFFATEHALTSQPLANKKRERLQRGDCQASCRYDFRSKTCGCDTTFQTRYQSNGEKIGKKIMWKSVTSNFNPIEKIAQIPKNPLLYVQLVKDTIRTFRFEPTSKKVTKDNVLQMFKDTAIWAILDTNVIHTQPFMFGIFNTFEHKANPNIELMSLLYTDSILLQMPQQIQFLGTSTQKIEPFVKPMEVLTFEIKPIKNPKLKGVRCWSQRVSISKEYLFITESYVSACDCATWEILHSFTQHIKLSNIMFYYENAPNVKKI